MLKIAAWSVQVRAESRLWGCLGTFRDGESLSMFSENSPRDESGALPVKTDFLPGTEVEVGVWTWASFVTAQECWQSSQRLAGALSWDCGLLQGRDSMMLASWQPGASHPALGSMKFGRHTRRVSFLCWVVSTLLRTLSLSGCSERKCR